MSSCIDGKKDCTETVQCEKTPDKKSILSQVHANVLEILTKMLSLHGEVLKQLMADGHNHDLPDAVAEMDCKEALRLKLGKVMLPEGEKKLLRLMYQPTDNSLKIFQGIERQIAELFFSGEAYLTENEGDIQDIPDYLGAMDKDGYKAIQLECAYPMDVDSEDFEDIAPDRIRMIVIPRNFIHTACFELRTLADHQSGGVLSKLPERLSEHVIERLGRTYKNEQKLLQSLITQSGVYAKGLLN